MNPTGFNTLPSASSNLLSSDPHTGQDPGTLKLNFAGRLPRSRLAIALKAQAVRSNFTFFQDLQPTLEPQWTHGPQSEILALTTFPLHGFSTLKLSPHCLLWRLLAQQVQLPPQKLDEQQLQQHRQSHPREPRRHPEVRTSTSSGPTAII